MTAKQLLLHETIQAYDFEEMSLLTSVKGWKRDNATSSEVRAPERNLPDELANREPLHWHRGIIAILEHVAYCKIMYLTQAFGTPPAPLPDSDGTLASVLARLDAARAGLIDCLQKLPDEKLSDPVLTQFHGVSAANVFWVLAQHDVCHGSQIDMLRDEFEQRNTN